MSDTLRAVALLVSLLLWAPAGSALLRGDVSAERAVLLYAGALLLSVAGCLLLSGLVRAYAPEEDEGEVAPAPARRAEDRVRAG